MTQPTHGLDPNALEAACEVIAQELFDRSFDGMPNSDFQAVLDTAKGAITAYLAALSQNPGTSNTSGEAGPVAWRFKADDPHYNDAYVYCATEEMALLRCPKNSKVEPLYAALEPRASDRARTIEPDYVYDPDNWECTYDWSDRGELEEATEIRIGEMAHFKTLIHAPDKWAAHVVLTRDDAGDPDETEVQWFDSEEAAQAAIRKLSEVSHE